MRCFRPVWRSFAPDATWLRISSYVASRRDLATETSPEPGTLSRMARDLKGESNGGCAVVLTGILLALMVWALVAAYLQGGFPRVGALVLLYFKVAGAVWLVVAITSPFRDGAVEGFAQVSALLAIGWVIYARTFSSLERAAIDLSAAVLAWLLTIGIMRVLTRRRDPWARTWREAAPKSLANLDALIWAALAWGLVSLFSFWRSGPLPADPARFARIGPETSIVREAAARWKGLHIGLALSGGGYRAAVFHAGVLEALESLGVRVTHLSTVSGGSLIGSYYAVGGDPHRFARALADGRLDLRRELMLAHNALRLVAPAEIPGAGVKLLPGMDFSRLDVQRALIERVLLSGSPLDGGLGRRLDPAAPEGGAPRLMIAVTDLTYGAQIGLLPDGFLRLGTARNEVYRGASFREGRRLTLAERAAISGAFPFAFPPRVWTIEDLRPVGATGGGERRMLLADGGLRDNTGLRLLTAAAASAASAAETPGIADAAMPASWRLDAILSSDGGAVFGVFEKPGGPLALLPRVFELGAVAAGGSEASPAPCDRPTSIPTRFSASLQNIDPDRQFRLHRGDTPKAGLDRPWTTSFSPERYPQAVLDQIIALLPKDEAPRSGTPPRPGMHEALLVRQSVLRRVYADLDVFQGTATLDDRLSGENVATIERLGRLLTYLAWPQMEAQLNQAAACRRGDSALPSGGAHPKPQAPS